MRAGENAMKRSLRWFAGLILIAGFTGFGESAAAGSPETSVTITIHVYNHAEVDHKALVEAEKVATGIFRKAGVECRWVSPALTFENKQENSADQGLLDLSHIQLDILPPLMAERLGLPNNVMGLAPGAERDRQYVYVFYNSVEALAQRQIRTLSTSRRPTHASTAQILGHVIAHEIGHALLNIKSHSATGIMRGDWNPKDLQDAAYGYLLFTPQQAEIIRADVGSRVRQHKAPEVTWLESPIQAVPVIAARK
jgi:hypothetical protein